jgi:hypothetical protein
VTETASLVVWIGEDSQGEPKGSRIEKRSLRDYMRNSNHGILHPLVALHVKQQGDRGRGMADDNLCLPAGL